MWHNTALLQAEVARLRVQLGNLPPAEFERRFQEELEAGWARIERTVLEFRVGEGVLGGGRFDTTSLGTWIAVAESAGLEYVPIHHAGMVRGLEHLRGRPIKLTLPEAAHLYQGMVRLDSCGSAALKNRSQYGLSPNQPTFGVTLIDGEPHFALDERTATALLTYVGQIEPDGNISQPVWWRPWVDGLTVPVPRGREYGGRVDSWPMEWRAFVEGGETIGVSAYYTQAPLSPSSLVEGQYAAVLEATERLLLHMRERGIQPWHPHYIGTVAEDNLTFSVDYLSLGPQHVVLLEAGPRTPLDPQRVPVRAWGAHPCCFEGRSVAGLALRRGR